MAMYYRPNKRIKLYQIVPYTPEIETRGFQFIMGDNTISYDINKHGDVIDIHQHASNNADEILALIYNRTGVTFVDEMHPKFSDYRDPECDHVESETQMAF